MPLTPVEVRHVELSRGLFGYNRAAVQRLLEDIADSFEAVWRERADLAERCEALETELNRHAELESLLRSTLVSAERASLELKEQARRESEVIVTEANGEARKILRDAITEKEQLLQEIRRVRALLRSALEAVEETGVEADAERTTSGPLPGTEIVSEPSSSADTSTGPLPREGFGGAERQDDAADEGDQGMRQLAG
jgi:cell division initiation protein